MGAGLLILLIITIHPFASKNVNFFSSLFTEPIESVYFIMKDGTPFKHTSHYEDRVYMSIEMLEKALKEFKNENYSIKHVAIIIHNHFKDYKFSHRDRKQHRRLKKDGFNGLFMLYSHITNKTYCLEEKK